MTAMLARIGVLTLALAGAAMAQTAQHNSSEQKAETKSEAPLPSIATKTAGMKRLDGFLPLDWQASTAGRSAIVRRFPLGPILGITPFNFPLNLVAHKVAPAIAAGCSIVIKPAPQTPLTALQRTRPALGRCLIKHVHDTAAA